MADKVKELEDRLNRLENRLKATFLEIEKRFEQSSSQELGFQTAEERLQEIEDLMLLLQLEITKIKDSKATELEFAPTPAAPDTNERLNRLEEAIASGETHALHETGKETAGKLEERISFLEAQKSAKLPKEFERKLQSSIVKELEGIEERLNMLESRRPAAQRPTIQDSVLEDVRKILEV